MTDFLSDQDLQLNDDDLNDFEEFNDNDLNDLDDSKNHNGGDDDVAIDESLDMSSSSADGKRVTKTFQPNTSQNSAQNDSSSSRSNTSNRIEQLPSTLKSEKDLKSQHDLLSEHEKKRFDDSKNPYEGGTAPDEQVSDSNESPPEDAKSMTSNTSRRSQRSHGSRRSSSRHSAHSRRSSKKRRKSHRSEVEMLRASNKQLQRQLIDLSRALDNQLNRKGIKMSKKSMMSDPSPSGGATHEEQINSLHKQLKMYKKSNSELKKQLYGSSSEKVVELKNLLKVKKREIKELHQEIVTLKNIQREQSKQLEVMGNGNEDLLKGHEEELRFASGEAKKYKEENAKMQAQMDKMHQQVVYFKDQASKANQLLKNKNISMNSVKQVKELQSQLEEERKKNEELERKASISQKALSSLKRKQYIEEKRRKQEKENLEEKIGELQQEARAGSSYNRARQMSEKRKRKSSIGKPTSPSTKNTKSRIPKPSQNANRRRPSANRSKIPKPSDKKPVKKPEKKVESKAQNNNVNKKEKKTEESKKPDNKDVEASLDFAADLDLDDEEFAADFDDVEANETEEAAEEPNSESAKQESTESNEETSASKDTSGSANEEKSETETKEQGGDIYKPPF